MNKAALITQWRAVLEDRLAAVRSQKADATAGTRVDCVHRPTNRLERAAVTSQGYLAHAMGLRAQALQEALDLLDEVGTDPRDHVVVGAVVELEDRWIALLPGGDATRLEVDGVEVTVISGAAPLARELAGLEEGDVSEGRTLEVLGVM